jgi:tetratricopeptide (TPR) repeat protein
MQSAYSNVKTQAALRLHKIYLERDDKNSAIAVLNEVINTCEKDDKLIAYDHLTAIYEDEKDYEQTIETLNSKKDLLSMRQGYIIDYRIALLEVLELGEYESGINRLDNLLNGDISPLQERRYTYGKGLALRHKGDLEEAKEVFNSIIERWPESYESKLSREELELLETDEEEE